MDQFVSDFRTFGTARQQRYAATEFLFELTRAQRFEQELRYYPSGEGTALRGNFFNRKKDALVDIESKFS